ncbi:MAG TPA: PhnD/SsuA/transferrin family substrate-binding protein [Opitutus sp.]|nr:PhnD/SsuA/transferrin family substrate-binding protein [Opitutus sp.]
MTGPSSSPVAGFFRSCLLAVAVLGGGARLRAGDTTGPPAPLFRLGFSFAMFVGINENDAKASIKALASVISTERGIPADPEPHLLEGTDQIAAALHEDRIDSVALTTDEYWLLRRELPFDGFLMAEQNGDPFETYVVITNRATDFAEIRDLRNSRLEIVAGPHMSLARIWLDVVLTRAGLPVTNDCFARVTTQIKASRAVLAVFFRQADAGIVSRRAFDTMVELNPQVAKQVRIIAASPPYVPSFFAFCTSFPNPSKDHAMHEFGLLHTSTAGQQMLTIFQTERITARPESDLRSALDLLEEHARLCPAASAALILALRGGGRTVRTAP